VDDTPPRYWFSAKRYGLGWRTPLTWEGWVVDLLWIAAMLAAAPWMRTRQHPGRQLAFLFGVIALFVAIRHWKGEPQPRG